jgi:hypothetical protein
LSANCFSRQRLGLTADDTVVEEEVKEAEDNQFSVLTQNYVSFTEDENGTATGTSRVCSSIAVDHHDLVCVWSAFLLFVLLSRSDWRWSPVHRV